MRLRVLPGALALCRLDASAPAPAAPSDGAALWSLTRAGDELSLVCPEDEAPADAPVRIAGYRALQVEGPLDLGLTGVMASLAAPLAGAGVPILPIATHDTDYVLVPGAQLGQAVRALEAAGFELH